MEKGSEENMNYKKSKRHIEGGRIERQIHEENGTGLKRCQ